MMDIQSKLTFELTRWHSAIIQRQMIVGMVPHSKRIGYRQYSHILNTDTISRHLTYQGIHLIVESTLKHKISAIVKLITLYLMNHPDQSLSNLSIGVTQLKGGGKDLGSRP